MQNYKYLPSLQREGAVILHTEEDILPELVVHIQNNVTLYHPNNNDNST
jgi:hypothetical protein